MAPIRESHLDAFAPSIVRRNPAPLEKSTSILTDKGKIIFLRSPPIEVVTGVTPPQDIPNRFIFVVFALIGAGFVITAFWFFFRAKNGGFEVITKSHWDNYKKSVVARSVRTGQSLSNATLSTKLGGGSIYHSEKSANSNQSKKKKSRIKNGQDQKIKRKLNTEEGTVLSSDMSQVTRFTEKYRDERRKKLREKNINTDMESIIGELDHSALDDLIAYRHEKPARVGGLNIESEASAFSDSVINGSNTLSTISSLNQNSKVAPKNNKKLHTGGIRKVISVSEGHHSVQNSTVGASMSKKSYIYDEDRIKKEAKRLQEKGRSKQHRDFSFQVGDDNTVISSEGNKSQHERRRSHRKHFSNASESVNENNDLSSNVMYSDVGTKTYHHPIPELTASSVVSNEYYEEKRRKRKESQALR
ncbi:hypothetical protein HI914_04970 [Erysiphe necator]|nr:hypothetical protein HI914_04970 [Erysiphe necator]